MNNNSLRVSKKLREIAKDNRHGSLFITNQAIDLLSNYVDNTFKDNDELIKSIQKLACTLVNTQESMAQLFNFGNELLFFLDHKKDNDVLESKSEIKSWCTNYKHFLETATDRIASHVLEIIPNHSLIGTYSYSETVYKALLNLYKNKKTMGVMCSEARPVMEGVELAKKLAQDTISTILTTDALFFSRIHTFDVIIVGADTLYIDGVINKIGTFPLALIANHESIPLYALCSTKKIMPAQIKPPDESLRDTNEILKDTTAGLSIENRYFDTTPLHFFTGIITEKGIEQPSIIKRKITSRKIHPSLQNHS